MKNTSERVMEEIYAYEARRTSLGLFFRVVLIILTLLAACYAARLIHIGLSESFTFDVISIISADTQLLKKYLFGELTTIFYEITSAQYSYLFISAVLLILALVLFIRYVRQAYRKLRLIFRFWQKKK